MKIGDLVGWSDYAAGWSGGPDTGEFVGLVVRVIPRISGRRRSKAKVEILADETFIVEQRMVEVINENR